MCGGGAERDASEPTQPTNPPTDPPTVTTSTQVLDKEEVEEEEEEMEEDVNAYVEGDEEVRLLGPPSDRRRLAAVWAVTLVAGNAGG
jgi:hypothetical protein